MAMAWPGEVEWGTFVKRGSYKTRLLGVCIFFKKK